MPRARRPKNPPRVPPKIGPMFEPLDPAPPPPPPPGCVSRAGAVVVTKTEEGGNVLVTVAKVETTSPLGRVVVIGVVNVVVGVVKVKNVLVVEIGGGEGGGEGGVVLVLGFGVVVCPWVVVEFGSGHVAKSVAVGSVWITGTVTVTGTCSVLTPP